MIFVTVGGDHYQFNRLVKAVDEYCGREKQEAFIQIGSSDYIPLYCQWKRFLSFKQMQSLLHASSIVISHAGAGTILACIAGGKVPIVVPRLSRFNEVVDDHQVDFAQRMQNQGYVYLADPECLPDLLDGRINSGVENFISRKPELITYLDKLTQL